METATSSSLTKPDQLLRIACLEPAATQVCLSLGLASNIVGMTHECPANHPLLQRNVQVLTANGLEEGASQGEIHRAVTDEGKRRKWAEANYDDDHEDNNDNHHDPPPESSLYPIVKEAWQRASPTVVFTQNLCSVCAPTPLDVERVAQSTTSSTSDTNRSRKPTTPLNIISLQPKTLNEVGDTFVTVSEACFPTKQNIDHHPGERLRASFWSALDGLKEAIESNRDPSIPPPKVLLLEWLDPPFAGGHWIHAMMDYACVTSALPKAPGGKSPCINWQTVADILDPDVIVVGCCGFDLQRNVDDTRSIMARMSSTLKAAANHGIFACDGNSFFAQPTPLLVHGVTILASCAYRSQPAVLQAIEDLYCGTHHTHSTARNTFGTSLLLPSTYTHGWEHVSITADDCGGGATTTTAAIRTALSPPPDRGGTNIGNNPLQQHGVEDIEDLEQTVDGFHALHEQACQEQKSTYMDPATGYQVFTAHAHRKRGACCGSGCRHCPYNHANLKDKLNGMQQPAFLYQATDPPNGLFSLSPNVPVKVLFFSGGKDSFLTIRDLVKQHQRTENKVFGLVLLTTFDASSRRIAHQEVLVEDVLRQAKHLHISLLGVPLHRGSGQSYPDRITEALQHVLKAHKIISLVFGDLHLEHIRAWRISAMESLDIPLEFPVWQVDYDELMDDLEASCVPCVISGSTTDVVSVGTTFDRKFYNRLVTNGPVAPSVETTEDGDPISMKIDAFGERGEFHSLARVWEVDREIALGLCAQE